MPESFCNASRYGSAKERADELNKIWKRLKDKLTTHDIVDLIQQNVKTQQRLTQDLPDSHRDKLPQEEYTRILERAANLKK